MELKILCNNSFIVIPRTCKLRFEERMCLDNVFNEALRQKYIAQLQLHHSL